MKFGISMPNHGDYGDIQRLVEFATLAESTGWDGFFLWDHISRGVADQVDPWITMSAIAARTERMRLGLLVTPLSRRRPWKVAREIVTLDLLSNGRMVLGAGLGDFKGKEFEAFGEVSDPRIRGEMLDESLGIISGLQSGEGYRFNGKHYKVKNTIFNPPPVQKPRVPVWVAGKWPNKKPFHRAAQWDGVVPIPRSRNIKKYLTLEEMAEIKAYIQRHRETDAPFDLVMSGVLPRKSPAEDNAILSAYEEIGANWWIEFVYASTGSVEANQDRVGAGPPQ
jgi:alkanesulfonate monooxygenase SsuD/methylene tetrahydromethanopterin reductase-like flavin-dependent oxidoreductase (luciferase family)